MSKIALKTGERNTSVTRLAVRDAVTGVFITRKGSDSRDTADNGRHKSTSRKAKKA